MTIVGKGDCPADLGKVEVLMQAHTIAHDVGLALFHGDRGWFDSALLTPRRKSHACAHCTESQHHQVSPKAHLDHLTKRTVDGQPRLSDLGQWVSSREDEAQLSETCTRRRSPNSLAGLR
jgi:hypothetical protein